MYRIAVKIAGGSLLLWIHLVLINPAFNSLLCYELNHSMSARCMDALDNSASSGYS
jgi:hypothetical protein